MNLWALSSTLGFLMQKCLNRFFHVKAVVAAFNQEKALEGAFSVITNLRMERFEALMSYCNVSSNIADHSWAPRLDNVG